MNRWWVLRSRLDSLSPDFLRPDVFLHLFSLWLRILLIHLRQFRSISLQIPTVTHLSRGHTNSTLILVVTFLSLHVSGPDLYVAGPSQAHAAIAAKPSSRVFHIQLNFRVNISIHSKICSLDSLLLSVRSHFIAIFRIPLFCPSMPRAKGKRGVFTA